MIECSLILLTEINDLVLNYFSFVVTLMLFSVERPSREPSNPPYMFVDRVVSGAVMI